MLHVNVTLAGVPIFSYWFSITTLPSINAVVPTWHATVGVTLHYAQHSPIDIRFSLANLSGICQLGNHFSISHFSVI